MKKLFLVLFLMSCISSFVLGQTITKEDYGKGLTIQFGDSDSKYMRIILWHQFWMAGGDQSPGVNFSIRRSRILAFTQFTDRFLVLTHFGLNSLNAEQGLVGNPNTSSNNGASLFLHGAWGEFAVEQDKLHLGAGLHYWNGISRLTSQSTLNFMTLDNPGTGLADAKLFPWSTITQSDQFARHLGIYAKGTLGKFSYRISANNARENIGKLDANLPSFQVEGNGKDWNYAGYFHVNLLDLESDKLPYFVGTYLGKKRILSIGGGFNYQPHALKTGTFPTDSSEPVFTSQEGVRRLAADVFYDAPVGSQGAAINALTAVYHNQYGKNPNFSSGGLVPGSGTITYAQLGFLLPSKSSTKFMPYITHTHQNLSHSPNTSYEMGLGMNWFISGHNAKITAEYNEGKKGNLDAVKHNRIRVQLHVFI